MTFFDINSQLDIKPAPSLIEVRRAIKKQFRHRETEITEQADGRLTFPRPRPAMQWQILTRISEGQLELSRLGPGEIQIRYKLAMAQFRWMTLAFTGLIWALPFLMGYTFTNTVRYIIFGTILSAVGYLYARYNINRRFRKFLLEVCGSAKR